MLIPTNTDPKVEELKNDAKNLVENTQNTIAEVGSDVKDAANRIQDKTQSKISDTKQEALALINSLKALLSENMTAERMRDVKDATLNKAGEWKTLVQDEVATALDAANTRTKRVVAEQPLLSLGVALAAGVLLGYVLGNKQSDN